MGILDKITEFVTEPMYTEIVTFDDCLVCFEKYKSKYPQVYAFIFCRKKLNTKKFKR